MNARRQSNVHWQSVGWLAALAVAACWWCGPVEILQAATRNAPAKPIRGTVVSVTNDSITISVEPNNPNDPNQLTFACSAQTTKVGLKTADGIQQVNGKSIGIGDRVSIKASVRGPLAGTNLYADAILIESQGGNKGTSTNSKKPE